MNDTEEGPSSQATEDFDVFLNHRGPDTKGTFVAHLDQALRFEGFRPFLDRNSLRIGDYNQESIYRALNMAKVHIAVVSKGYAESQYCLDELVAMKRSQKPVIPVFYDVEPNDLRRVENGKFAKAFNKHKSREIPEKKLQEWTDALLWLAGISGFCFDTTCRARDEAKLKQEVVDAVTSRFPHASVIFNENDRVGLEDSRKEVVRKLESGRVGVVGLYGMGGIGKTTLAEAVYNYFVEDFTYRSFVGDVRSSDTLTLQNQVIKNLRLGMKVNSCDEYRGKFYKFKDLKVLIVVDDIDEKRQFEDIIPNLDGICEGSKIIVTSRNRGLLSNVLKSTPEEKESSVLHEVEQLNRTESQQLFNIQAFHSKSPGKGFEDLAMKVADACSGHPLALEIAGGFLSDKKNLETDRELWDEIIASGATQNDELQSILKISYEKGLDDCQKLMFRDISCHLIGEPSEVALEIWSSCKSCGCGIHSRVHSSLRGLTEKCLVKLDVDGRLRMHDVLRDMGRQLVDGVSNLGERTHFWDPEVADAYLEGGEGSNKVRGFSGVRQGKAIPSYEAEAFSKMSELHLLVLDGCHVSGDFSKWSRKLRLLQWSYFPLRELPLELNLAKTVVLDLSDSYKLTRLWNDETPLKKAPMELRRLILNGCEALTTLSQDIGKQLSKLKVLELNGCIMLESLPDSIGEMKDLEQLLLYCCERLQSIPNTVGRLKKLKHLDLSHCKELRILPNLGTLTALTTLKLTWNDFIRELPESFKGLTSLVRLKMSRCCSLRTVKALPPNLQHLGLGNCKKLAHLPSFEGLTSLATLTLCNCPNLAEIQGLDCLTTLEEVNLAGCTSMQPFTLQLQHNRPMRSCYLSGSNVSVKYDSDWSQREPALQVIAYYGDAFRFVNLQRLSLEVDCHKVCKEATVSGENECVAVVICFVARIEFSVMGYDRIGGYLDACIVREDQEVFRSQRFLTFPRVYNCKQVYLCTLRRTHPLVRNLKHGDKIQVATSSHFPEWRVKVESGAICVIHGHGEDQVISVNSKLLDVQQSREMRAEFAGLILVDNLDSTKSVDRQFLRGFNWVNNNSYNYSDSTNSFDSEQFTRLELNSFANSSERVDSSKRKKPPKFAGLILADKGECPNHSQSTNSSDSDLFTRLELNSFANSSERADSSEREEPSKFARLI